MGSCLSMSLINDENVIYAEVYQRYQLLRDKIKMAYPGTWNDFNAETALKNEVMKKVLLEMQNENKYSPGILRKRIQQLVLRDIDIPCITYNDVDDWDKDHWFYLPLNNTNIFQHLTLKNVPELLKGKLYSTRMPRDLESDPTAKTKFQRKVVQCNLHTVVILTEHDEYQQYAGTDLEAFYASLHLKIVSRPIKDFCVPRNPEMMKNIKDVLQDLSLGRNVLVHCAGGSGRTGLVICGVIRECGIKDPVKWARQIKSTYVETPEQETFVKELPMAFDSRLAKDNPKFVEAVVCERLITHMIEGTNPNTTTTLPAPFNVLDDANKKAYKVVFDLLTQGKTERITVSEARQYFHELGATPESLALLRHDYHAISLNMFYDLMLV